MNKKLWIGLLAVLLTLSLCTMQVFANSAEPPSLTVLVVNPPEDLEISLLFSEEVYNEPIVLEKREKAWESYYRFFRTHKWEEDYTNSYLNVTYGEESFKLAIPYETFTHYNNLLTLDVKKQTLTFGQPVWRTPLLIFLRVSSTLLIEGILFYLFKYREKKSWLIFLITNLITQGLLNLMVVGGDFKGGYIYFNYILGEWIILVVETIIYMFKLKEHEKSRAFLYGLLANLLSLALGGYLITHLPV